MSENEIYQFRKLNTKSWMFKIMLGFAIASVVVGVLNQLKYSVNGIPLQVPGGNGIFSSGLILLGLYSYQYSCLIRIDKVGVLSKTLFRTEFLNWKEITDNGIFITSRNSGTTRIDPDEMNTADNYGWNITLFYGEGITYVTFDFDEEAWRLVKKYRWN